MPRDFMIPKETFSEKLLVSIPKKSGARIGLIPKELSAKMQAVGNAALSGEAMLLLNEKERNNAFDLAKSAVTIELATSSVFAEKYMTSMFLKEI